MVIIRLPLKYCNISVIIVIFYILYHYEIYLFLILNELKIIFVYETIQVIFLGLTQLIILSRFNLLIKLYQNNFKILKPNIPNCIFSPKMTEKLKKLYNILHISLTYIVIKHLSKLFMNF